jgi:hypothetical protein
MMGQLHANPNSSSVMEISWQFGDDIQGIIQSITVTQTAPDGTTTPQSLPPDSLGPTYFMGLQANTLYNYELDAPWEDENGGINTETLTCSGKTKAGTPTPTPTPTRTPHPTPTPTPPDVPIPPEPITNLTASWNHPDYNKTTVTWNVGSYTNFIEVSYQHVPPRAWTYGNYLPSGDQISVTLSDAPQIRTQSPFMTGIRLALKNRPLTSPAR